MDKRLPLGTFLLASSLDRVREVLVVENHLTEGFVRALKPIVESAGARLTPIRVGGGNDSDVWVQDAVEIGHVVGEGPGVLAGLRSAYSDMDCASLDEAMTRHFESRDVRWIDLGPPRADTRWVDWFGNLEVSPPSRSADGMEYPHGRVLVGRQRELSIHPNVLGFLETQAAQWPPIIIDTSWLRIGHVDEVVNFVPAGDGFRALIPDPRLAAEILAQLPPGTPVFAGTPSEMTSAQLLEIAANEEQQSINRALDATREQVRDALGLTEGDFAPMPAIFRDGEALIPNAVNSLICNGHVIAPTPRGPVVDGEDRFERAIREQLEPLGIAVHFIDNWEPYHVRAGEVHCGTNTVRSPGTAGPGTPITGVIS